LSWDEALGELRVRGRRYVAVDIESLCGHLDALVGAQVAEVIMNNHQFRLGREDAARLQQERPVATVQEIVEHLAEADSLSGMGKTKVRLPEIPGDAVLVEISNPAVKGTAGSSKAFAFSYWAAALSFLLGRKLEASYVTYNARENRLSCRMVGRMPR
jgi:hypothetical protein